VQSLNKQAAAEEEVAARTEAEKQRRENEAQLAVKMLDPKLVEEQVRYTIGRQREKEIET